MSIKTLDSIQNMYAWLMHLMSKMFGNTAKKNMEKNINDNAIAEGNWMGPDGTESGPGVLKIGT